MIYAYILAAVLLLAGGVTTCNYAQKVSAESEAAALEVKAALDAKATAEANLASIEENARIVVDIQREAAREAAAIDTKYRKVREELAREKNRKPVPKECVSACRDDWRPVARVVDGMRSKGPGAAAGGRSSIAGP